jgi:hypothetical protein
MEEIFPEYLKCINIVTDTSLYLLERYFLPEHFQRLNVREEERKKRFIKKVIKEAA